MIAPRGVNVIELYGGLTGGLDMLLRSGVTGTLGYPTGATAAPRLSLSARHSVTGGCSDTFAVSALWSTALALRLAHTSFLTAAAAGPAIFLSSCLASCSVLGGDGLSTAPTPVTFDSDLSARFWEGVAFRFDTISPHPCSGTG
jgi:hypothetical protein